MSPEPRPVRRSAPLRRFPPHASVRGEDAPDVPLAKACRLWATGDIRGAAEVFAALERTPVDEAFARLAAGRQFVSEERHAEADVELLRAIELYRPLGARRYLDEAEALLSAAAATAQPG